MGEDLLYFENNQFELGLRDPISSFIPNICPDQDQIRKKCRDQGQMCSTGPAYRKLGQQQGFSLQNWCPFFILTTFWALSFELLQSAPEELLGQKKFRFRDNCYMVCIKSHFSFQERLYGNHVIQEIQSQQILSLQARPFIHNVNPSSEMIGTLYISGKNIFWVYRCIQKQGKKKN